MLRALFISITICSLLFPFQSFPQTLPSILTAIRDNDLAKANLQVASAVDISVVDADGDNALMYAALYSSTDCMKLLLKAGIDVNAKNKLGETALIWSSHDIEKAKLLLDHKADVNAKTVAGNTVLLAACAGEGQTGMIKLLLDKGADPLAKNTKGRTSLMQAALFGDTAAASLLMAKGININAKTKDSETALFMAVKSVNRQMVYWLLNHGADANILDNYKALPLSYAVTVNEPEIAMALLQKTININTPDIDGMTLLMWATYSEYDNPQIIQALLDRGARLDLKDKNGSTALGWALKKGNTATVALLKKAGAQ
jgi:ankyrin repeat protein